MDVLEGEEKGEEKGEEDKGEEEGQEDEGRRRENIVIIIFEY